MSKHQETHEKRHKPTWDQVKKHVFQEGEDSKKYKEELARLRASLADYFWANSVQLETLTVEDLEKMCRL